METPYGYTLMSKMHGRIIETPYGYTFMSKIHGRIMERRFYINGSKNSGG